MEYTLLNPIILMFATMCYYLIVKELGPFNVLERMRFGRSLCFDCVSVWTALIASLVFIMHLHLLFNYDPCNICRCYIIESFIDALLKMS